MFNHAFLSPVIYKQLLYSDAFAKLLQENVWEGPYDKCRSLITFIPRR